MYIYTYIYMTQSVFVYNRCVVMYISIHVKCVCKYMGTYLFIINKPKHRLELCIPLLCPICTTCINIR